MGCDIHLYVEVKTPEGWRSADKWTTNTEDYDEPHTDVDYDDRFYRDRNYDLFAILAGVRDERGFAGCDTGAGFNPIAPERGLPSDVSPNVQKASDQWDCDGHSHSWLTVAELLEYDWTQTTTLRGWVDAKSFAEWSRWARKHGEMPESYCGGVSGYNVRHITEQEMQEKIEAIRKELEERGVPGWCREFEAAVGTRLNGYYCKFEHPQAYYQCARRFWSDCIPRLLRLGKPEDVRIVFWFDN
jgi:hypothetical protein